MELPDIDNEVINENEIEYFNDIQILRLSLENIVK